MKSSCTNIFNILIDFCSKLSNFVYSLIIKYNFEVLSFSGSKELILSTISIFGGKNNFLGIAYTVVGCCCLLLGSALLVSHKLNGKILENDVDIAVAIEAEHMSEGLPKIMLEVASNHFLNPRSEIASNNFLGPRYWWKI